MQGLHGSLARPHDAASRRWTERVRDPICVIGRINLIRKTEKMAQTENRPLGLVARTLQAEADAVLEQMFGYFTREDAPRLAEAPRRAA